MKFGISDNSCMFVAISDQGITTKESDGHFYVLLTTLIQNIRLFKSHVSRYFSKVMVPWSELRGEQSFSFYNNSNFVDTMTKENEICKGTNNSSPSTTPTSAKTASKSQSKLEKEIAAIQKKVATLQADCKTHEAEKYRLLCYIDRYCSALFSYFLESNPLNSQDWKKLHKQQLDIKDAIK